MIFEAGLIGKSSQLVENKGIGIAFRIRARIPVDTLLRSTQLEEVRERERVRMTGREDEISQYFWHVIPNGSVSPLSTELKNQKGGNRLPEFAVIALTTC